MIPVIEISALPLLLVLMLASVTILQSGGRRSRSKIRRRESDDVRLIREIDEKLNRLEDRIEALETVLIETRRTRPQPPIARARDLASASRGW